MQISLDISETSWKHQKGIDSLWHHASVKKE